MALPRVLVCTVQAGCSTYPQVNWRAGPVGATPAIYPLADLIADDSSAIDTRGATLASPRFGVARTSDFDWHAIGRVARVLRNG